MKSIKNRHYTVCYVTSSLQASACSWTRPWTKCKFLHAFYIVDSDSKNCIQYWIVDWIVSFFDLRTVIIQQVFKCKDWLILDCNLPGVRPAGCWKSCYISLPLWCDGQELGAGLNIDHVRLERENITCFLLHGPDIQLSFAPRTKNQR